MSVIKLTKENFEQEVIKSEKPVIIDFSATWCGPCQMLAPIVDEIAEEIKHIKVCKVDIDDDSELAANFRVMSVPTLIYLKNGKVVNKSVGAQPKDMILERAKLSF